MSSNTIVQTILDTFRRRRITPSPPPLTFTDQYDREVRVRPYAAADLESLVEMYDRFDSASRSQGVPPLGTEAIREWLATNLAGPSAVALVGDRIVGHVSFVPDGTERHELAIFVHQDFQRAGIGSRLLGAGMGHAAREGVEYVWASVDKSNRGAHRLYSRAGFSVVNPMGITYRMSRYL